LRSELVLRCIDDWLLGQRFDLSAVVTLQDRAITEPSISLTQPISGR